MKVKHLLIPIFLLYFHTAFSQTDASSAFEVKVTIIEPIRIVKSMEMNFGNIVAGYTSGTVVLSPTGSRTANGVIISEAIPGEVSPAVASVIHGSNKYSITLPSSFVLVNEEKPNEIVIIDQFTVVKERQTDNKFADIIKIGATLNISANQLAGNYISETGFSVTVSYN